MSRKGELCSAIIDLIALHGALPRPELVRRTGVRPATVFAAVDELKRAGILAEPGRTGLRTGRRAPMLDFTDDDRWTVGIDFRERRTVGVVLDGRGVVRQSAVLDAVERGTLAACRNEIRAVLRRLHSTTGSDWSRVRGVALADPGLVDLADGVSIQAVNVPGWKNARTREWLSAECGVPAAVWPGALAGGYVEYLEHINEFEDCGVFYLLAGEGIGASFIKAGQCFIGDTYQAMEIGHLIIDPAGPLCQCGNRGCLEALAGGPGIRRKLAEAAASGVAAARVPGQFTFPEFIAAARSDKAIHGIAEDIALHIGKALAAAVTLLNPGVIVLGGDLAGLGDMLADNIVRVLNRDCIPGAVAGLKIVFAGTEADRTARGAALLMRRNLLQES